MLPTLSFRSARTAMFSLALPMLLTAPALAQDSDSTTTFQVRPTFGLGVGMLSFHGDVGNDSKDYNSLLSRVGYELRAVTPINEWLEVGLYAMHGRVGVNERSLDRNLNFESRITTGGFQLTYNFHQLLRPQHVVEPYLSIGFESMEFLSKTDMLDAQGREYHYWSDGTIRDIDEHAVNAGDAVLLQRDYTYESDVRELNLDGFGRYDERTWAVPVGVGVRMLLGGGFDFRLGTTMHFTQSDLIDGVTSESVEGRTGDGRLDRLLFTSVSMNYAIGINRKQERMKDFDLTPEQMDMLVLNDDEDADGVSDFKDECPGTPAGAKVDLKGCPLDGDGDGVPDGIDEEPTTAAGSPVDVRGITITDDEFLKAYLNYKDSGNVNMVTSRVESIDLHPHKTAAPAKRIYTVQVGNDVEGITEEQMQKLLSIPDLRTVEHGDTTSFLVGGYDDLPEALRRQLRLEEQGIEGMVMTEENGHLSLVNPDGATAQGGVDDNTPAEKNEGTIVRVQLGAFRYKLGKDIFSGIKDLIAVKGDDGLTRYYTGTYTDMNEAAKHKVDMLGKGFGGAFLVAFKNGKRVSLKEAGARLSGPENMTEPVSSGIDKSLVQYRVQVGTFAGNVPTDVMSTFIEMGNVEPISSADAVRYYYGNFPSRADADDALKAIQAKGISDAFVVGSLKGRIIAAEDADRILSEP